MPHPTPLPVVVITGASSGIGYELSKLFARDAYHLVLIARSADALHHAARTLQHLFGVTVTTLAVDLSRRDAPEEIATELKRQHLQVRALVNNAGFGLHGSFMKTDLTTELAMIHLHVTTLTHLTKLLLPDLIASGQGKILNVASTAAFQSGPLMGVYSATKAYVLSFSEALANELREHGVSVTALCPGPTSTAFQRRAGIGVARLTRGNLMSAQAVARIGYRGLMRHKTVVVPGMRNRLCVLAVRLLSRNTITRLVRLVQERREPT